jgi:hypothetical protein
MVRQRRDDARAKMPEHVFHEYITGIRKKGRHRKIWLQDVERDMGVKNLKLNTQGRYEWRKIVESAKVRKAM